MFKRLAFFFSFETEPLKYCLSGAEIYNDFQ